MENDSGFITSSALTGYATETWVGQQGYLTSVSWGDITGKPAIPTNYVTTDTAQTITGDKTFANIKASSFVTTGANPKVSITQDNLKLMNSDGDTATLTGADITLSNTAHDVKFGAERLVIDQDTDYQYILAYKDIAKVSQIPTKTSQLTNDSNFVTSEALAAKQDKLTAGTGITIDENNVISSSGGGGAAPENMVTTDTEQEITGKKTIKSTNPYYWAEIGVIDDKNVPGISFKDNYSKVNIYRDSNDGYMKIETPSFGTPVQIKNVLIEERGDRSTTIRSVSTSYKLHLGDASRPISTLYATNLSDGTTTKSMTEVLSGTTEE